MSSTTPPTRISSAKALWASRHPLDPAALVALATLAPIGVGTPESREILWPADYTECYALAIRLTFEFEILLGVWPAQAVEAFLNVLPVDSHKVFAPVSVPETEPDQKKVRPFRFVRWACIR